VAVLAALAGGGTAWLVSGRLSAAGGPPGGPTVVAIPPRTIQAETENASLREQVRRLQAEVAEVRISAAARKAFPDGNPAARGDPLAPPNDAILDELSPEDRRRFDLYWRALRAREDNVHRLAAAEAELRSRLERAFDDGALDSEKRERLVRLLMDGSEKMRLLIESTERGARTPEEAAKQADAMGKEARESLREFLTEEQIGILDRVLAPPEKSESPPEAGPVPDPVRGR
jgi:hypothetical protein